MMCQFHYNYLQAYRFYDRFSIASVKWIDVDLKERELLNKIRFFFLILRFDIPLILWNA